MGRKTPFNKYSPTTQAKWESIAMSCSQVSESYGVPFLTKDEILKHLYEAMEQEGYEASDNHEKMYLERMRYGSLVGGKETPTLDLINMGHGDGMYYRWLRNEQIPTGFLSHSLSIVHAFPRIMYDYFMLIAKGEWTFEELVDLVGPDKCLLFLLNTEYQVHMNKDIDESTKDFYLGTIAEFKQEVLTRITREEKQSFYAMLDTLMLGTGEEASVSRVMEE